MIRVAVVVVMIASYVVAMVAHHYEVSLVILLLSAYGAVVQFAPAVIAGLYFPSVSGRAVMAGMVVGSLVTVVLVLRPSGSRSHSTPGCGDCWPTWSPCSPDTPGGHPPTPRPRASWRWHPSASLGNPTLRSTQRCMAVPSAMAEGSEGTEGVVYEEVDDAYFEQRSLTRYARVWSLWPSGSVR